MIHSRSAIGAKGSGRSFANDDPRMGRLALVLLLTTVAAASDLGAQTTRNAVYFEVFGSAIVPSFNYERRLGERWHGRAGISGIVEKTSERTKTTAIVPLTLSSVNRSDSNHRLELGGGVTYVGGDRQGLWVAFDRDENISRFFLTGILGYRYQKPAGGFQFRAVLTPIVGEPGATVIPGVSAGYAW
jgi:hypothetical protein